MVKRIALKYFLFCKPASFLLLFWLTVNQGISNNYVVTLTTDNVWSSPQVGELRWAVAQANANPGPDIISFNIPGPPPQTVLVLGNLLITDVVYIDGNTQPLNGYQGINKRIFLQAGSLNGYPSTTYVFSLMGAGSSGSTVKNMDIGGHGTAVRIESSSSNYILNNVLRTGIWIYSGNNLSANYNIIQGNIIGTDQTLQIGSPYLNGIGVFITSSINGIGGTCKGNIIGGLNPGEGNKIYNSSLNPAPWSGVQIVNTNGYTNNENKVSGNVFVNCSQNISILLLATSNNGKITPSLQGNFVPGSGYVITISNCVVGDVVELYRSNLNGIDALQLIGTTTANQSGNIPYNIQVPLSAGDKIIATLTDTQNNTSEFSAPLIYPQSNCLQTNLVLSPAPVNGTMCVSSVAFSNDCTNPNATYMWSFGDGSVSFNPSPVHQYQEAGTYQISCTVFNPMNPAPLTFAMPLQLVDCNTCKTCIGSFAPEAGDYIVSLWVKEDNSSVSASPAVSYPNTGIRVTLSYPIASGIPSQVYAAYGSSSDPIIDGWQRIEKRITIPNGATEFYMELVNNNSSGIDSYFDDVRIHPVDANMKSYVYDPVTLRLTAELDENNYGTFYEYDEEGRLTRVKKETEKGIMTIKETRTVTGKR